MPIFIYKNKIIKKEKFNKKMANNKSIQILRGTNANIVASDETLLPGQPLYNLTKGYLTIGGGGANGDESTPLTSKPIVVRELVGYSGDTDDEITANTAIQYKIGANGTVLEMSSNCPVSMAFNGPVIMSGANGQQFLYCMAPSGMVLGNGAGYTLHPTEPGIAINNSGIYIGGGSTTGKMVFVGMCTPNVYVGDDTKTDMGGIVTKHGGLAFISSMGMNIQYNYAMNIFSNANINMQAQSNILIRSNLSSIELNAFNIRINANAGVSIQSSGILYSLFGTCGSGEVAVYDAFQHCCLTWDTTILSQLFEGSVYFNLLGARSLSNITNNSISTLVSRLYYIGARSRSNCIMATGAFNYMSYDVSKYDVVGIYAPNTAGLGLVYRTATNSSINSYEFSTSNFNATLTAMHA